MCSSASCSRTPEHVDRRSQPCDEQPLPTLVLMYETMLHLRQLARSVEHTSDRSPWLLQLVSAGCSCVLSPLQHTRWCWHFSFFNTWTHAGKISVKLEWMKGRLWSDRWFLHAEVLNCGQAMVMQLAFQTPCLCVDETSGDLHSDTDIRGCVVVQW